MNHADELRSEFGKLVARRWFLRQCGVGLGFHCSCVSSWDGEDLWCTHAENGQSTGEQASTISCESQTGNLPLYGGRTQPA